MDATKLENEQIVAPEPLSGMETSKIVEELYSQLPVHVAAHLVDPNVVLTIAAARGQTEFFIRNPSADDAESIHVSNRILDKFGLRFRQVGRIDRDAQERPSLMVSVDSLKGYERVSKQTKIPGVLPFESSTGWEGYNHWSTATIKAIIDLSEKRMPHEPNKAFKTIHGGLVKGYPDQAIWDYFDWDDGKEINKKLAESNIPLAGYYPCAQPNFDFYPEHASDPAIIAIEKDWNRILEEFYNSPWHQKVKDDPVFQKQRGIIAQE